MALNDREDLFVTYYIELGEAKPAALKAGYAESTANEACMWINPDTLKNPDEKKRKKFKPEVYAEIRRRMDEIKTPAIASAQEVLEYFTSVLRGKSRSSVLARDELGADRVIEKPPDEKERLKAAEQLGKRYGLFTENVKLDGAARVVIVDDLED